MITGIIFLVLFFFFWPKTVLAVCPVCTVAVGAGLGLSRLLGIDDTISGVWIGGLILSSGLWLADFLTKKNIRISHLNLVSVAGLFLMVIIPLYLGHFIGLPANTFWGIDKVLLGIIAGSLAFWFSVWLDGRLRSKNGGKVLIYYQKVILPIFFLSILSLIFYFLTLH